MREEAASLDGNVLTSGRARARGGANSLQRPTVSSGPEAAVAQRLRRRWRQIVQFVALPSPRFAESGVRISSMREATPRRHDYALVCRTRCGYKLHLQSNSCPAGYGAETRRRREETGRRRGGYGLERKGRTDGVWHRPAGGHVWPPGPIRPSHQARFLEPPGLISRATRPDSPEHIHRSGPDDLETGSELRRLSSEEEVKEVNRMCKWRGSHRT